MERYHIGEAELRRFAQHLQEMEYTAASVEKYVRNLRALSVWLGGRALEREDFARWKAHLLERGYRPETVNGMLAAANGFFRFMGWEGYRIKYLKIQRRLFRSTERELTREEYLRMIERAKGEGRHRLALLLETICATGIRVSEVRYITVEAARTGCANIALKGKVRTILIPGKLRRKLCQYARAQKISAGEIFVTRGGRGMSRRQIWAEMKALGRRAGVEPSKVFPHNLRHLFARTFYRASRDVARLADVLGHSCIETTRIYLISTGVEEVRRIERLGLIS